MGTEMGLREKQDKAIALGMEFKIKRVKQETIRYENKKRCVEPSEVRSYIRPTLELDGETYKGAWIPARLEDRDRYYYELLKEEYNAT